MHRVILGCTAGEQGDHIDLNTLNNRRYNLRKCTHLQNSQNQTRRVTNTSGFKNVFWDGKRRKWYSRIFVNRSAVHLGMFLSKEEAAHAYDAAARVHHGAFARLKKILLYHFLLLPSQKT